ncbi:MAG: YceD family protein [Proteobacteria bacterium]|nr:YceD family protein [Pseudomonadota bacterium]
MYARPIIDSLDFAENGKQIDAKVPVAELSRLQELLDNPQGSLHYILQGGQDDQGRFVLDISINGSCQLRCQRCLKGMDYAVQHDARLLLCDQASLDALDDQEEEFDGILADKNLDVLELLEDEILLSLPIAPMHDLGACQADEGEDKQKGKRNPFAVLENLKRN